MVRIEKLENRRRGSWLLVILFAVGLACLGFTDAAESRAADGSYVATDWARRYKGPGGIDEAVAIGADAQGNVYVTGTSLSEIAFPYDFLTIKYSPDGRRLWTRRHHSPENYSNEATAMAVDRQGNVYVTGMSVRSETPYHLSSNYLTVKYNTDGQLLWERFYDGPAFENADRPAALAVDGQGNVLVTVYSTGDGTGYDYATVKYGPDGQEIWVRRYNGPEGRLYNLDSAISLAVDGHGNVCVTGSSSDSWNDYDTATIKYSAAGEELWVRRYSYLNAGSLAVDTQGNILLAGSGYGKETGYNFSAAKYSPEGRLLWVRHHRKNNGGAAKAIAVDALGNVLVTGYSEAPGYDNADYTTVKYTPEGKQLWARRYNGPENGWDNPSALAVDGQGNVYVTGGVLGIGKKYESATIKYSPEGRRLWLRRYRASATEDYSPRSLALDSQGNVYITGRAGLPGTFEENYLTIKYKQAP